MSIYLSLVQRAFLRFSQQDFWFELSTFWSTLRIVQWVFTSWHRKYMQKLPWSIASLIFINIWLLTHVVMLRNKREFISICTRDSAVLPEWDISVIWNSEHASKQGYPKKWRKKKAYLKQFKLYHKILYWEELHKFFLKGNHEQGPVAPSSSQNPLFHAAFTWQITVLQNTGREVSSGVQSSKVTTVLSHCYTFYTHLKRYNNLNTPKHTL